MQKTIREMQIIMHDQRENRFVSNMIQENATQSSRMTEGKCKDHSEKLLQVWVTPGNDRKENVKNQDSFTPREHH